VLCAFRPTTKSHSDRLYGGLGCLLALPLAVGPTSGWLALPLAVGPASWLLLGAMDAEQQYLFDLNGYIVLRDALDAATVASLLADNPKRATGNGFSAGEKYQQEMANGLTTENGRAHMKNDQDALHWGKAYRDILAHHLVCDIVQEMCGPDFRLDHINVHARPATYKGGTLHGGSQPGGGNGFFFFNNGVFQNGLVSVTYELEDTHCNGGGFCCVPGAALPARILSRSDRRSSCRVAQSQCTTATPLPRPEPGHRRRCQADPRCSWRLHYFYSKIRAPPNNLVK